ncbi:vinorine synthase-like [Mercurialis annua]|uniref:vinorine synthase-like n=1 Tax=Mercurialis annua TaxID=3986 RepID=UPI00215E041E|nr:vinorine synthase-like [Mercurialis annua]
MSKEMIKPSSPTPPHLKIFKLCLIDQFFPSSLYTPLLLFYPINQNNTTTNLEHLKSSLSSYLSLFYPLAGRINDATSIECNDEGVIYVQANVHCPIIDILEHPPEVQELEQFFLPEITTSEPLLLVQVSSFSCGGIAIGLRMSHKIADAATICIFLKGWAAMASSSELLCPDLTTASSVLPPLSDPIISVPPPDEMPCLPSKPFVKRLVFDGSKIAALKANATSSSVANPTRVEAVLALVWKHIINTSNLTSGFPKFHLCSNFVNLRNRVVGPSSENAVGNLVAQCFGKIESGNSNELELKNIVSSLRKGLKEFNKNWIEKFQENDGKSAFFGLLKEIGEYQEISELDWCNFSSLCKMPLYDSADFGWGKPKWIAFPRADLPMNSALLMDSEDNDGIEVWLSLKRENMALILQDQQLLNFAKVNPTII